MNKRVPPLLIRASAGSGKTYRLSNRLIQLLLCGEKPERILATTFTKKAAGEIQNRLFTRLSSAYFNDGERAEVEKLVATPISKELLLEVLCNLIKNQHTFSICTLDSFFLNIAKTFTLELGLPFSWTIAEEIDDNELKVQALSETVLEDTSQLILTLVRLLQKGNVKQSVLRELMKEVSSLYAVFRGTDSFAWNSFEVKSTVTQEQVKKAVHTIMGIEPPVNKNGSPDGVWSKSLAGLKNQLQYFPRVDWGKLIEEKLLRNIIEGGRTFARKPYPEPLLLALDPLIAFTKEELLRDLKTQTVSAHSILKLFSKNYEEAKIASAILRFDDIKYYLAQSQLTSESQELYYRLDSKIAHVLFDEFQDTSTQEWDILEPIVEEILSSQTHERSFFCVGDVKQAIYGWRGGVADIFQTIKEKFPVVNEDHMEKSYRSSPILVSFINTVFLNIENSEEDKDFERARKAWTQGFIEHTAAKENLPGFVSIAVSNPAETEEEREEGRIAALCSAVRKVNSELPGAHIGILLRRNKLVPRVIYELNRLGIFASEEGGNPLTDEKSVLLLLSILKLADHPGDLISRYHVASSPLAELLDFYDTHNDEKAYSLSKRIRRELTDKGYGKVVLGLVNNLRAFVSKRELLRLLQLAELSFSFQNRATSRVMDFITFIHHKKVESLIRTNVRVMTVHQAKGLEFDFVFLPELDFRIGNVSREKVLMLKETPLSSPSKIIRYPKKEIRNLSSELEEMYSRCREGVLKEELSVLYVALTRARYGLGLITSEKSGEKKQSTYSDIILGALGIKDTTETAGVLYEQGSFEEVKNHSQAKAVGSEEGRENDLFLETRIAFKGEARN